MRVSVQHLPQFLYELSNSNAFPQKPLGSVIQVFLLASFSFPFKFHRPSQLGTPASENPHLFWITRIFL